jgi:hypothetical protein
MNTVTQPTHKYALGKAIGSACLLWALLLGPSAAFAAEGSSGKPVRASELNGALPIGYSAHYLALEPAQRDGTVTLTLTFGPQNDPRVGNRVNLWVLSRQGLQDMLAGDKPANVAIAAGNPTVLDADEEKETFELDASFKAFGRQTYTVIVYSRAPVSTTYTLAVDNAMLVDASGQTKAADKEASEQTSAAAEAASEEP